MKIKIVILGAFVGLMVLLSGCTQVQDEVENGEVVSKMSFTEIRIGDIPTDDFSHINVTFSEIRLHKSDNNDSGWVNISTNQTTVDLIYLHINNLTEQLGIAEIETGNYTKLWIIVENATGVLKATNETIYFDVPSGILKIQQLFKLQEGNNTITVDIDLNNSILVRGEMYKILPVISGIQHHHENKLKFSEGEIIVEENGSRGKPIKALIGQNITFNATETFDIVGDDINYSWDFGDGTNDTGAVVVYNYNQKGSYWVVLTVNDGDQEFIKYIHVIVK
ncbi:MAG: DUF4382 domain-containing protein [Thermoplasmatales archaeon]|nr:MAG: DUF4382 domain-containing protein [Thermoplasmatales archaeon]